MNMGGNPTFANATITTNLSVGATGTIQVLTGNRVTTTNLHVMNTATLNVAVVSNLTVHGFITASNAYCDLFKNGSNTYVLAADTYQTLTNWTKRVSTNITTSISNVTLTVAGDYMVNLTLSFDSQAADTFEVCVFTNDAEVAGAEVLRESSVATSLIGGSTFCILQQAAAGTRIGIKVKSAGGADIIARKGEFVIRKQ
jgi:hypothetical protein